MKLLDKIFDFLAINKANSQLSLWQSKLEGRASEGRLASSLGGSLVGWSTVGGEELVIQNFEKALSDAYDLLQEKNYFAVYSYLNGDDAEEEEKGKISEISDEQSIFGLSSKKAFTDKEDRNQNNAFDLNLLEDKEKSLKEEDRVNRLEVYDRKNDRICNAVLHSKGQQNNYNRLKSHESLANCSYQQRRIFNELSEVSANLNYAHQTGTTLSYNTNNSRIIEGNSKKVSTVDKNSSEPKTKANVKGNSSILLNRSQIVPDEKLTKLNDKVDDEWQKSFIFNKTTKRHNLFDEKFFKKTEERRELSGKEGLDWYDGFIDEERRLQINRLEKTRSRRERETRRVQTRLEEAVEKLYAFYYKKHPFNYYYPWVTTILPIVQIILFICQISFHGFAPTGLEPIPAGVHLSKTINGYESFQLRRSTNIWIGPPLSSLLVWGAVYAPCLRPLRKNIANLTTYFDSMHEKLGCCESRDMAGTMTEKECTRGHSKSVWHDGLFCSKRYRLPTPMIRHNVKPCCIGYLGECRMITKEHCINLNGSFVDDNNAEHCRYVDCLARACYGKYKV
ncbi:DgyrCDS11523 [Dimorphilus gyrociliatus]|uniref:DgyrCDS11523 n=1 Tax=Dimorphilus gyrociliatus TaxID=2664684 RepID=A0A7I8W3S2_9ANNE|nr:DgyrCDS11523 [Dimorphilus gyrociliatus]